MATTTGRRPQAPASPPTPRAVVAGDQAFDQAFARLAQKEAPCIGVLGKSGAGKTEAANRLIVEYLRRSKGVVIVIDDKELAPRYPGQYFRDPQHIPPGGLKPEPRIVVFRGVPHQMIGVDHELVGRYQHDLYLAGMPSLCVHDEQGDAAAYGQWLAGGDSFLKRQYVKGRVLGQGKIWLSQFPDQVPVEPWSQSTCMLCFAVDEGTINRLKRYKFLNDQLAATLRTFPEPDGPPSTRGYFMVLQRECRSDGRVYRF